MATAYVGFRLTIKSQQTALRLETLPAYSYKYVCQRQKLTAADAHDARCVVGGDSTAAPRALLWGDSNAAHYVGMFGAFVTRTVIAFAISPWGRARLFLAIRKRSFPRRGFPTAAIPAPSLDRRLTTSRPW